MAIFKRLQEFPLMSPLYITLFVFHIIPLHKYLGSAPELAEGREGAGGAKPGEVDAGCNQRYHLSQGSHFLGVKPSVK